MDALTLTKVILSGKRFRANLNRIAEAQKQVIDKSVQEMNQDVDKFVDSHLQNFLLKNKEFREIAKGPKDKQRRFLKDLRKTLKQPEQKLEEQLVEKAKPKLPKSKIPSAKKMWNKKVERDGRYVMYDQSQHLQKSRDPYPAMSDSEARQAKKRQRASDLQKHREHLRKSVERSPASPLPPLNPSFFSDLAKGNPEGFMAECIQNRMAETGSSEPEAREWCQNYMDQQLGNKPGQDDEGRLESDYDKTKSAKDIYEGLKKKKAHWLEGHESQKKEGSQEKA